MRVCAIVEVHNKYIKLYYNISVSLLLLLNITYESVIYENLILLENWKGFSFSLTKIVGSQFHVILCTDDGSRDTSCHWFMIIILHGASDHTGKLHGRPPVSLMTDDNRLHLTITHCTHASHTHTHTPSSSYTHTNI